jgi:hypothetical protein
MKFLISILIAIGLAVFVFILIIKGFSNHPNTKLPQPLTSYATTNSTVQFIISGPITADQTHQSVTMNVGQIESVINVIQGYQGQVISSKSYSNNETSYLNFLSALQLAGFSQGTSSQQTTADLGYCPFGDKYNLQIIDGTGQAIQNYWTDSCSNSDGTFRGVRSTVEQLFTNQIPDYDTLTLNVNI